MVFINFNFNNPLTLRTPNPAAINRPMNIAVVPPVHNSNTVFVFDIRPIAVTELRRVPIPVFMQISFHFELYIRKSDLFVLMYTCTYRTFGHTHILYVQATISSRLQYTLDHIIIFYLSDTEPT